MPAFDVKDMSCGHCVASITQAVQAMDPGAQVVADLDSKRVQIESTQADAQALRRAIEAAGFTPEPLAG